MPASRFASFNRGSRGGSYRSKDEELVAAALADMPQLFSHESAKLPYNLHRSYTPDFSADDVHIEVKGWWSPEDRAKIKAVRLANPNDIILVVLSRPELTISKTSKTTYAQWCEKWGILWVPLDKDPAKLRQCLENVLSECINRARSAPVQMGLLTGLMDRSSASSATNPAGPEGSPSSPSSTGSRP